MNYHQQIFSVPDDYEFDDRIFYVHKLWRPAIAQHVHVGSRRRWRVCLKHLHKYQGRILRSDGAVFNVPDIESVFPDPDMKWMGDFLASRKAQELPRSISNVYLRLKLIYLYCEIRKQEYKQCEPRRVCRRLFLVSYAAIGDVSVAA